MKSSNYLKKKNYFPLLFVYFQFYKRTHQDIETILTPFDVFLKYTHLVQISIYYSYFYYKKT